MIGWPAKKKHWILLISAPRKERSLILETLSKCVTEMAKSFRGAHSSTGAFHNDYWHLNQL